MTNLRLKLWVPIYLKAPGNERESERSSGHTVASLVSTPLHLNK